MTLTALVTIGGVVQSSGTLTAFAADEVRGVQGHGRRTSLRSLRWHGHVPDTMYGEADGDELTFQFQTNDVPTTMAESLTFEVDGNIGSVVTPFVMTAEEDHESEAGSGRFGSFLLRPHLRSVVWRLHRRLRLSPVFSLSMDAAWCLARHTMQVAQESL